MTSVATAMMSAALFSRRSLDGWLGELDEIRGESLIAPDGEVDVLMEPVDSLAATGLDRPMDWPDPSDLVDLAPAPHRINPAEMWHPQAPAAAPAAAPVALAVPVDPDGTVVLRAGILRLGPEARSEVRLDSGRIRVELPTSWCWATLGHESEPVTVSLPSGTVALDPGTTALVAVEDDASAFVAVASGRAVLVEPHGSTPLSAGTVALAPVGGPAQVGQASAAEIDADPLVAHNRDLDARL